MGSSSFLYTARLCLLGTGLAAYAIGSTAWLTLPAAVLSWNDMAWRSGDWPKIVFFLACLPFAFALLGANVDRALRSQTVVSLLLPLPIVLATRWICGGPPDVPWLMSAFTVLPIVFFSFFQLHRLPVASLQT
jgi:Mn2+/Fe2+ NRAMP family transporter